eukprot:7918454-Lingulodinium_polyedra.AAC.1
MSAGDCRKRTMRGGVIARCFRFLSTGGSGSAELAATTPDGAAAELAADPAAKSLPGGASDSNSDRRRRK